MEAQFLKQYEKKLVSIILKNNFRYSYIKFNLTDSGLVEFEDKDGLTVHVQPEFVSMISEANEE